MGYFLAVMAARTKASALRITLWATLAGIPLMAAASLILGEDWIQASSAGWAACLGMGLMHVVGQGGVAWALGRLPASITAVTILIQPVVAAALGWAVFGETLAPIQAIGGILVLGAIVAAQRAQGAGRNSQTRTGAGPEGAAPV